MAFFRSFARKWRGAFLLLTVINTVQAPEITVYTLLRRAHTSSNGRQETILAELSGGQLSKTLNVIYSYEQTFNKELQTFRLFHKKVLCDTFIRSVLGSVPE